MAQTGVAPEPDLMREPDLTVWFDLTPEVAAERLAGAKCPTGSESQPVEFFRRVAQGYADRRAAAPAVCPHRCRTATGFGSSRSPACLCAGVVVHHGAHARSRRVSNLPSNDSPHWHRGLRRSAPPLLAQRGHAWLLQGPSGMGQYALGLELVRAWLCDAPTPHGACGQCAPVATPLRCAPMRICAC